MGRHALSTDEKRFKIGSTVSEIRDSFRQSSARERGMSSPSERRNTLTKEGSSMSDHSTALSDLQVPLGSIKGEQDTG